MLQNVDIGNIIDWLSATGQQHGYLEVNLGSSSTTVRDLMSWSTHVLDALYDRYSTFKSFIGSPEYEKSDEVIHCRDCWKWHKLECPMVEQYQVIDFRFDYDTIDRTPKDGSGHCHFAERADEKNE